MQVRYQDQRRLRENSPQKHISPFRTLGHIQHTCGVLSELHTMAHHRCWRLIHGERACLASPKWGFICINGAKCFRTMWKELAQEFAEVFDHCAEQTLWNTAREKEMARSLTPAEEMRRRKDGIQAHVRRHQPICSRN